MVTKYLKVKTHKLQVPNKLYKFLFYYLTKSINNLILRDGKILKIGSMLSKDFFQISNISYIEKAAYVTQKQFLTFGYKIYFSLFKCSWNKPTLKKKITINIRKSPVISKRH